MHSLEYILSDKIINNYNVIAYHFIIVFPVQLIVKCTLIMSTIIVVILLD